MVIHGNSTIRDKVGDWSSTFISEKHLIGKEATGHDSFWLLRYHWYHPQSFWSRLLPCVFSHEGSHWDNNHVGQQRKRFWGKWAFFLDLSCYSAVGSDIGFIQTFALPAFTLLRISCKPEPACLSNSFDYLPETYKLQENASFRTYSFSVPNKSQLALFQDQLAHQAKLQWQSVGPGLQNFSDFTPNQDELKSQKKLGQGFTIF